MCGGGGQGVRTLDRRGGGTAVGGNGAVDVNGGADGRSWLGDVGEGGTKGAFETVSTCFMVTVLPDQSIWGLCLSSHGRPNMICSDPS